jgi:hypothetical protein
LDEGIIQAYLDGELAAEAAAGAEAHLARCAECAGALAEAGAEAAFLAAAFVPDETVAVPTEILRARIGAAVARLEDAAPAGGVAARGSLAGSLLAPLRRLFAFTPRQAAAFASLLAVVAFAVLFAVVQRQQAPPGAGAGSDMARADATPTPTLGGPPPAVKPLVAPVEVAAAGEAAPTGASASRGAASPTARGGAAIVNAGAERPSRSRQRASGVINVAANPERKKSPAAEPDAEALLPGEENYRQAIASLSKAVELGGDAVMSPKARFDYERSLALLDSAINETRRVALRDPKDKETVSFLMAAYQSKVELLTTVADQAQVAAIGR